MFEILKLRIFVARVQAELKAQHNSQSFVNLICQHPKNLEILDDINRRSYFRKTKIAPFLAVCQILGESLDLADLPFEQRMECAQLLAQRIEKVRRNNSFHLQHILLFGNLEETLMNWIERNQK